MIILCGATTTRHRMLVFHDPAHRGRSFSDLGSSPARRHALLEFNGTSGGQLDVWLCPEREGVTGWLDTSGYGGGVRPLRWTPEAGLEASDALAWATDTFGPDNGERFRAALAQMCARAWADLAR